MKFLISVLLIGGLTLAAKKKVSAGRAVSARSLS